ncbi:hypothetical protein niasHT_039385 [Heterodera trifolii]|uniref:Uncharacterized protein n=1 Tax=Heterodera trifolii TaxID=157864 RepID=A0ABD2HRI8_9BILA
MPAGKGGTNWQTEQNFLGRGERHKRQNKAAAKRSGGKPTNKTTDSVSAEWPSRVFGDWHAFLDGAAMGERRNNAIMRLSCRREVGTANQSLEMAFGGRGKAEDEADFKCQHSTSKRKDQLKMSRNAIGVGRGGGGGRVKKCVPKFGPSPEGKEIKRTNIHQYLHHHHHQLIAMTEDGQGTAPKPKLGGPLSPAGMPFPVSLLVFVVSVAKGEAAK